MNRLRRLPTRKLLAVLAGVVVGGGSVTAVAVAALGGSGPIPPAKTLATAIHDALDGPKIDGVTAQIQFTNNLIDTSSIPGAGPLLSGASGRLWADGSGDLRLELQAIDRRHGDLGDARGPSGSTTSPATPSTGTLPTDKSPTASRPTRRRPSRRSRTRSTT